MREVSTAVQLVIGVCFMAVVYAQTNPVVETDLGKIKGSMLKSLNNKDIYAFRGIRYAQAPVNEKRFKAPVAVEKWDNEFDATKDGYMCPQTLKDPTLISEDCLVLNVYSRSLTATNPVIVYIHGGANIRGGSHSETEAGPQYLLDSEKEIVLVTFNYRLGALGFLSTRTSDAPGNFGYLDQVMALKWVQSHISKFGGNPNSVTILGLSAGSMAVTLHMVSPLSQKLFHGAVALSGSATSHYDIDNLQWTTRLARETSCPMYNPEDVLSCLRDLPWETIVAIPDKWEPYLFINMKWNFEIDGHFLTDHPSNLFAIGNFTKVPIIAGTTTDEFKYMVYWHEGNTRLYNDVYLNLDKYGPEFFTYSAEEAPADIDVRLKTLYLENKPINDQSLENFGNIFSDAIINHGVHRLVSLAREYVDVFYYRFDYAGRFGLYNDAANTPRGVSHGDDIQYIFKSTWFSQSIGTTDPEIFMVDRMVGYLTSFAYDKVPQKVDGVEWLPSNLTKVITLYNDKIVSLGDEPYVPRYELWDSLFPVAQSGSSTVYATGLLTIAALIVIQFSKYIF